MELVAVECPSSEFFDEPIQIVFHDADGEYVVTFISTVPHYGEAAQIYGDLFLCRARDIDDGVVPIRCGSDAELQVINKLQSWADSHFSEEQEDLLRNGKFPRMSQEMVWHRGILWFISVLRRRRDRE